MALIHRENFILQRTAITIRTMGTATLTPTPDQAFRAIQRRLADALGQAARDDAQGPTLEAQRATTTDAPRLARAAVIEGNSIKRHQIASVPEVAFGAFVDGIQASRVLHYDDGIPIVRGKIGAVVRARTDRRLTTWKSLTGARLYAPLGCLSAAANAVLRDGDVDVVDTTPRGRDGSVDDDARHPLSLAEVAVNAVQGHREALEQELAESWCKDERSPLYIDGGINSSARLSASSGAVGVVKSHRTLYGDPSAVRTILSLGEGERSSAFTIASSDPRRSAVTSWYLRINDASRHDPLWGLVRVEVAPTTSTEKVIGERADLVSRWILAEVAPLSLPDSRWHTMVYGIRDCEQYLRAIT